LEFQMVDLQSLEKLSERKHGKGKTKVFRHNLFETFPVRDTQGWALKYSPPVIFGYRIRADVSEDLVLSRNPEIGSYHPCNADIVPTIRACKSPLVGLSPTVPSKRNTPSMGPLLPIFLLTPSDP
jgi:hypothetical protein